MKTLNQHFWKKYFDVYDTLNELIPYRTLLQTIAQKVAITPGMSVLDLGCGTGNLIPYLIEKKAVVTGIDFSHEGLVRARNKNPRTNFIYGDITKKLPFPDAHFDRIVSNNTTYTLTETQQSFLYKELFRILKPNGRVVISNIATGFKPLTIYTTHIRTSLRQKGFFYTCKRIAYLSIPTIKIFYYNRMIQRAWGRGHYTFVTEHAQRLSLEQAGFVFLHEQRVYAENGVLTVAEKK